VPGVRRYRTRPSRRADRPVQAAASRRRARAARQGAEQQQGEQQQAADEQAKQAEQAQKEADAEREANMTAARQLARGEAPDTAFNDDAHQSLTQAMTGDGYSGGASRPRQPCGDAR
jgi:hypothetical protein